MVFKIDDPFNSDRKFSQSLAQVTELLGMYHVELAKILGQQCGNIGDLASGKRCLDQNTEAGQQACYLLMHITCYSTILTVMASRCTTGCAHNKHLKGTPHFLIVDDGKLELIHTYLLQRIDASQRYTLRMNPLFKQK